MSLDTQHDWVDKKVGTLWDRKYEIIVACGTCGKPFARALREHMSDILAATETCPDKVPAPKSPKRITAEEVTEIQRQASSWQSASTT